MRGKKIDNDFLTDFISTCANNNKCLPSEIIGEAQQEIDKIDIKIKEVELLKKKRSKLLDVITVFSTEQKVNKEGSKTLHYFNIENQHICKFICDMLVENNLQIQSIKSEQFVLTDILFCIKQLLEYKIIYRTGESIVRGINFEEYCSTVLAK